MGDARGRTRALFVVLLSVFLAGSVTGQEHRALLIGINTYVPEGAAAEVRGRSFSNLQGTHNDVAAMRSLLTSRFGFEDEHVQVLHDAEATRQGILDALDDLVRQSQTGALRGFVFYYSGHGSQVHNTASPEADGLDETLVPSDAYLGVEEVRDKEVRRRFNALLENGIELTAIYDNCHSGSASRGVGAVGAVRRMEPGSLAVSDPPPYGREPGSSPAALIVSAAGENQLAREFTTEDGSVQGAFTHALVYTLRTAPEEWPARLLFQQTVARLKGLGFDQNPQLEAGELRYDRPFFGSAATGPDHSVGETVVPVQKSPRGDLTLLGGPALGIREGTVLRHLSDENEGAVRLRVAAIHGPASAEIEVVDGSVDKVESGDLFGVEAWGAGPADALSVYLPPPLDSGRTSSIVEVVAALERQPGFVWTANPVRTPPTHVLEWEGSGWQLHRAGEVVARLGEAPTSAALERARGAGPTTLFLHLPPSPAEYEALREAIGALGASVRVVDAVDHADYLLAAHPEGDLAWFYRRATATAGAGAMPAAPRGVPASLGAEMAAAHLAQLVLRLSALWGWLHLEAPGGTDFPYRLDAFVEVRTEEDVVPGDTLRWGEGYRVRLTADPGHLRRLRALASLDPTIPKEWYLYLFAVDCTGAGGLLHGRHNEARVNLLDAEVPEVLMLGEGRRLFRSVRSCPEQPIEADQFFLLATADPLPDPRVLEWRGVGANERSRFATSPLSALLAGMSNGQRGAMPSASSRWWVSTLAVPSAEQRP